MGKYADKKALLFDTRFNGGGDLLSDLAMFFTGQKFLDYATDKRSVGGEPTFRWTKPTLARMPVLGTCSFVGWEIH